MAPSSSPARGALSSFPKPNHPDFKRARSPIDSEPHHKKSRKSQPKSILAQSRVESVSGWTAFSRDTIPFAQKLAEQEELVFGDEAFDGDDGLNLVHSFEAASHATPNAIESLDSSFAETTTPSTIDCPSLVNTQTTRDTTSEEEPEQHHEVPIPALGDIWNIDGLNIRDLMDKKKTHFSASQEKEILLWMKVNEAKGLTGHLPAFNQLLTKLQFTGQGHEHDVENTLRTKVSTKMKTFYAELRKKGLVSEANKGSKLEFAKDTSFWLEEGWDGRISFPAGGWDMAVGQAVVDEVVVKEEELAAEDVQEVFIVEESLSSRQRQGVLNSGPLIVSTANFVSDAAETWFKAMGEEFVNVKAQPRLDPAPQPATPNDIGNSTLRQGQVIQEYVHDMPYADPSAVTRPITRPRHSAVTESAKSLTFQPNLLYATLFPSKALPTPPTPPSIATTITRHLLKHHTPRYHTTNDFDMTQLYNTDDRYASSPAVSQHSASAMRRRQEELRPSIEYDDTEMEDEDEDASEEEEIFGLNVQDDEEEQEHTTVSQGTGTDADVESNADTEVTGYEIASDRL